MSPSHIQKSFDDDLHQIKSRIIGMAEMVHQELDDCMQAFSTRDAERADESAAADDLIDASEDIIDDLIVEAIVLHQPMASDCRRLIAALHMTRDLERVGDYAKNIAKHSIILDTLEPTGEEQRVLDLGHAVTTMLEETIRAYQHLDSNLAAMVRDQDEDIDLLYTKIFADLLKTGESPNNLQTASTHLVFVARSLERIGDHVTNIAEQVVYIVEGQKPQDERPKADDILSIHTQAD